MTERPLGVALVTGATGAVGPALVRALVQRGYGVRVLVRQTPPAGLLLDSVELIHGDLDDPQTAPRAVAGVRLIFHLAARLHINEPTPAMTAAYRRTNVDATRWLVEAAQAAGVKRLLFCSTISVYGACAAGQILDEQTPVAPQSLYAETKWLAEEVVRGAQNLAGQPLGVVLRLAAVYGPHMRGNYCTLARALSQRRFFYVGSGQNRRTLVFDADVARAAILAAESAVAAGQTYNVSDGQLYTLQQIVETICHVQRRQPPALHLPQTFMRSMATACQAGAKLVGLRAPFTPALIDKLTEDVAVSSAKLQRQLGFAPSVGLKQGWLATLQSKPNM